MKTTEWMDRFGCCLRERNNPKMLSLIFILIEYSVSNSSINKTTGSGHFSKRLRNSSQVCKELYNPAVLLFDFSNWPIKNFQKESKLKSSANPSKLALLSNNIIY